MQAEHTQRWKFSMNNTFYTTCICPIQATDGGNMVHVTVTDRMAVGMADYTSVL